MKRFFTILLLINSLILSISAQNCVNSGDALAGVAGWGSCTTMGASAASTLILTTNATTAGNRFFHFVNTANTTNKYIFKAGGNGTSNPTEGKAVVFEVQGLIRAATAQSRNPSGTVNGAEAVVVTATLDGALSTGQAVYLRHTTNGFTSSTVTKMTGSGTTYTATIPGVAINTTVQYYLFTSGDVASIAPADVDLFTINLLNNGGTNYSYTTSSVLDANLLNLSAEKKSSSNLLAWQTASEKDNAQFNIQRSSNNQTWQTIGSVKATNSANGAKYNFTDEAPLSTINYYRLQMVENSGKMDYSKVVSVSGKDGKQTLSVYPNPVKSELTVLTDGNTDGTSRENREGVSIFDMTGKMVRQYNDNRTRVNVQDLPNGIYFMRLLDKNGLVGEAVRFVKQ
jgi:hypothetical protein